jgi:hypothetical protein
LSQTRETVVPSEENPAHPPLSRSEPNEPKRPPTEPLPRANSSTAQIGSTRPEPTKGKAYQGILRNGSTAHEGVTKNSLPDDFLPEVRVIA